MKTYNTYQDAKIANPEYDIYIHGGLFVAEKDIGQSLHTYKYRGFFKCNPADYCMTVEQFLRCGHKAVEGDWFMIGSGMAEQLIKVGVDTFKLSSIDHEAFILRAAALEPKQVEWKNGDECVITRYTTGGEKLSDIGTYYAETETHYWLHGIGGNDGASKAGNIYSKEKYSISKPETESERLERERLEAAYDLYCEWASTSELAKFSFDEFIESPRIKSWCAIVDKTNYRK